jgi:hypothetical protein
VRAFLSLGSTVELQSYAKEEESLESRLKSLEAELNAQPQIADSGFQTSDS